MLTIKNRLFYYEALLMVRLKTSSNWLLSSS